VLIVAARVKFGGRHERSQPNPQVIAFPVNHDPARSAVGYLFVGKGEAAPKTARSSEARMGYITAAYTGFGR
jgi:hypothetical protein